MGNLAEDLRIQSKVTRYAGDGYTADLMHNAAAAIEAFESAREKQCARISELREVLAGSASVMESAASERGDIYGPSPRMKSHLIEAAARAAAAIQPSI